LLTTADILEALTANRPMHGSLIISEAVIDSRLAFPASMFVAMRGERVDGHDYVADAFRRGARLALIQHEIPGEYPIFDLRPGVPVEIPKNLESGYCLRVEDTLAAMQKIARFWRRKMDLRVLGITGSVGKSTTKELVAEVLGTRYSTLKNQGNLNNEIGLPLTLLRMSTGHQRAVLEMGFYVLGEIAFLCDLAQPVVGIVTNIGTVHAERAGSQAVIAQGKAELVKALPSDPAGTAILNFDDPWVRKMANQTRAKVFFYGLSRESHLWADDIVGMGLEGIRFNLHYGQEQINLRVPLIGRHSVQTALRAAAAGLVEGLGWDEIIPGLQKGTTQLRLAAVRTESGALMLDDTYNASPESTIAALNLLSEVKGRRIAVLGDMLELGQYEQSGHELVGCRAAEVCDSLLTVGMLGRKIAEAALQAGLPGSAVTMLSSIPESIEYLRQQLREGDIVLVKGSHGMRMEQIISALEGAS
jgi:UDP-N-acetylmuramoyl-tripeptide--D-alanyl-D-alanine ligase